MKNVLCVAMFLGMLAGCNRTRSATGAPGREASGLELKKLEPEKLKKLEEPPLKKAGETPSKILLSGMTVEEEADLAKGRKNHALWAKGVIAQPLSQKQIELMNKYGYEAKTPPPPNPGNIQIGVAWGPHEEKKDGSQPIGSKPRVPPNKENTIVALDLVPPMPMRFCPFLKMGTEALHRITKRPDGVLDITIAPHAPSDYKDLVDQFILERDHPPGWGVWSVAPDTHLVQRGFKTKDGRKIVGSLSFKTKMDVYHATGKSEDIPFWDSRLEFIESIEKKSKAEFKAKEKIEIEFRERPKQEIKLPEQTKKIQEQIKRVPEQQK